MKEANEVFCRIEYAQKLAHEAHGKFIDSDFFIKAVNDGNIQGINVKGDGWWLVADSVRDFVGNIAFQ